jgi:hypothetical protein
MRQLEIVAFVLRGLVGWRWLFLQAMVDGVQPKLIPLQVGASRPGGAHGNPFLSTLLTPHSPGRLPAPGSGLPVPRGEGAAQIAAAHTGMSGQLENMVV